MKRNPDLSIRKPEALSAARAAGLNPSVVGKWFQQYEDLLEELAIKDVPSHLWNCDESGLQDQFCSTRVVGEVGKPCVEVTAGEKGETTTVLAAFNAAGTFSQTMVIFKGKRLRCEWLYGCPENVAVRVSDNGWINRDLFQEWGQMFTELLPKDDPRPHVLLLDGHSSHVYNLDFIQLMKAKNVHVMAYPPHTTHALQPADKALFKSLKHNWYEEGRKWIRRTAGQKLPKTQFFSLFHQAWQKTATVENAQAGFRGTGMFPVNKNIIHDDVFSPSITTERAVLPTGTELPVVEDTPILIHRDTFSEDLVFEEEIITSQEGMERSLFHVFTPEQDTSNHQEEEEQPSSSWSSVEVSTRPVTFSDLIPIPKRERSLKTRARPPTYHLTSTDHINYITSKNKKQPKGKNQKGNRAQSKSSKYPCAACQRVYGDVNDPKATEDWVCCCPCNSWYHESCGEDNGICDEDGYICKDCL